MKPDNAILAAIDLGSNSFHLIVARVEHGEMRPIETLSEKVQLGAGLRNNRLNDRAIQRGLDCLSRFRQVLDSVSPYRIRVVGTNALRQADNRQDFTRPARELLGVPVEVIYGIEEARLVYLGVAHTLADDGQSRLVVDIGGGSTEFIIGQRFEPRNLDSLQLGCVSSTRRHFKKGRISPKRYRRAYDAARLEVSHIRHHYQAQEGAWTDCVGSSGTLQAIETILVNSGWSDNGITRQGLTRLEETLLSFKRIDDIHIEGLTETRRSVILAGVAITAALFDELHIERMRSSPGALREGVIYDLLGRLSHEDVRERTINALMQRYNAEPDTADIVERRAQVLFEVTHRQWKLDKSDWALLRWAARTHEIGMAIAHKHFNKHGAYLLRNADLPGFSLGEQEILAQLVLCHTRKLSVDDIESAGDADNDRLLYLITLLRLANLFKYVEQPEFLPEFSVEASPGALSLRFPDDWLEQHPLTARELKEERTQLKRAGIRLDVR